jgi:hypothetical protein
MGLCNRIQQRQLSRVLTGFHVARTMPHTIPAGPCQPCGEESAGSAVDMRSCRTRESRLSRKDRAGVPLHADQLRIQWVLVKGLLTVWPGPRCVRHHPPPPPKRQTPEPHHAKQHSAQHEPAPQRSGGVGGRVCCEAAAGAPAGRLQLNEGSDWRPERRGEAQRAAERRPED